MKLFEFPALGEKYWQERLPNGLCVRVVPKPGFARRYAFLAVSYWAKSMPEEISMIPLFFSIAELA